jgi:hypothetical protein
VAALPVGVGRHTKIDGPLPPPEGALLVYDKRGLRFSDSPFRRYRNGTFYDPPDGTRGAGKCCVMRINRFHILSIALALLIAPSGFSTPVEAREWVAFEGFPPGTIVVKTNERKLYFVVDDGHALRYPVGVGRAGKAWAGRTMIDGKYVKPAWAPPPEVRRDEPWLPKVIPGGSPRNPMGVAALTLAGGEYAIHGTNAPKSIGGFVSYGCIRMYNEDILDLYRRVRVGTRVVVLR